MSTSNSVYPTLPGVEEGLIIRNGRTTEHFEPAPTRAFDSNTMKNFHGYATLKTTGQLVMDLGSVTTHIAGLIAFLQKGNTDSTLGQFFLWFLVGVIIFQVIVAIGLYIFRWLDLNDEVNHRTAYKWNIVFFVAVFLTSICEAFLGIFEKFGLEHGAGGVNGTTHH